MDTSSADLDDSSVSLGNCILTPTTGRHNRAQSQCWWHSLQSVDFQIIFTAGQPESTARNPQAGKAMEKLKAPSF